MCPASIDRDLATIAKSARTATGVRTTVTEEISAIWDELKEVVAELEAAHGVVLPDSSEDERLGG